MTILPNKISWAILGIIVTIFSLVLVLQPNDSYTGNESVITKEVADVSQTIQETEAIKEVSALYPVIKITDGDTIDVSIDGQKQTIRLIGLNTPETVDPRKPVECFGKEASNKAKELLTGKRVVIEKDDSQGTYDKYQRLLAYVFLEDGTNFNKWMIENGYGYEYTYNLPYKYQKEFKMAQEQAKAQGKGLWANNACQKETETTVVPTESTKYICTYDAYNCGDFSTHNEAQSVYEACGGVNNDIHKLDRDKDGLACETLP